MNVPINHATQRRLRMEAAADWLGLAYRCLFTVMVTTPLWGTALALAIIWNRLHLQ